MFKVIKDFFHKLSILNKMGENIFKDPVTGLYNRRYFEEVAKTELANARRYDRDLTFVMMDVNNFKRINDQFGHDVGDKVLTKIGELLEENSRESDLVARWGGDEFVALLPGTSKENSKKLLKRVTKQFNEYINKNNLCSETSLSYGIESWKIDNLVQVSKRADRKMYYHKDKTKNGN